MKERQPDLQPAIPTLDSVVNEAAKAHIQRVLVTMKGNVSETAHTLGLTRQGLYKKMKRLGIRDEV